MALSNPKLKVVSIERDEERYLEAIKNIKKFNLEDEGFVITDNIGFHGYVEKDEKEIKSRNLRGLIRKIKAYIEYLKENPDYVTTFYKNGDGIAVTQKKEVG